ncbi:MAG: transglutaminase domain-containing protein [Ruminococcus sp.]|nr:transglutaminase domain-containing protein [Ruminococcus sp.]
MNAKRIIRNSAVVIISVCAICCIAYFLLYKIPENKENKASESEKSSFGVSDESVGQSSVDSEDLYDTSPISQAYLNGDTSALDEFQLSIYSKAIQILGDEISEEMTDYEKELAIHDYLVTTCEYDEGLLTVLGGHSENAENPYGALIEGKAICSGYTTSFQMFMDMLGIPCRSIKAGDTDDEEHAWNMVEIDGEWYYVDVTWDDPVPDKKNRPTRHAYFNVTYDIMAERHVWDNTGFPEADSFENSYTAHNLHSVSSWEEVTQAMEDQLAAGNESVYFEFDESMNIKPDRADELNYALPADYLSEDLKNVTDDFADNHKGIAVYCRRAAFGDRAVLEISMKKQYL